MAETISETLRQKLTTTAAGRCEYCQSPESFATERFSIEHIEPRAVGGLTVPENPALACQGCNGLTNPPKPPPLTTTINLRRALIAVNQHPPA